MAYAVALHHEHVRLSVEQVGAYFAGNSAAPHQFRTLVVSGGHSPVFESICDVLATRLEAER
jgi:hypothetical protein